MPLSDADLYQRFKDLTGKDASAIQKRAENVGKDIQDFQDRLNFIKQETGPYDHPAGPPTAPPESIPTGFAKGLATGASDSLKALRRLTGLHTQLEKTLSDYGQVNLKNSPSYWPRVAGQLIGELPAYAPSAALTAVPGAEPIGLAGLATTGAAMSPDHPIAGAVGAMVPGVISKVPAKSLVQTLGKMGAGAAVQGGATAASGGDSRDVGVSAALGALVGKGVKQPKRVVDTSTEAAPTPAQTPPPVPTPISPVPKPPGPALSAEPVRSLPQGSGSKAWVRFQNRLKAITSDSTGQPPVEAPGTVPIPLGEASRPAPVEPPPPPSEPVTPPVSAAPPEPLAASSSAPAPPPSSPLGEIVQKVAKTTPKRTEPTLSDKSLASLEKKLKALGVHLTNEEGTFGDVPTQNADYRKIAGEVNRDNKNYPRLKRDDFTGTSSPGFHEALQNVGESYRGAEGSIRPEPKNAQYSLQTLRRLIPDTKPYKILKDQPDEALIAHAVKYANQTRDLRHRAYDAFEKAVPGSEWKAHPTRYVFNIKHKSYNMGDVEKVCE